MNSETVWEFETAKFRIALEISPEDTDPADSFQFDEDIEAVRSGQVEWFCASVAVYFKDHGHPAIALGRDSLGGCAYTSVREFYESHRKYKGGDYFTDMVREAVHQARTTAQQLRILRTVQP